MKAKRIAIHIIAVLYIPIMLAGMFVLFLGILIKCMAFLIILEPQEVKRELGPITRSLTKRQ